MGKILSTIGNKEDFPNGYVCYDVPSYASAVTNIPIGSIKIDYSYLCKGVVGVGAGALSNWMDMTPAFDAKSKAHNQAKLFCNLHAKMSGRIRPY